MEDLSRRQVPHDRKLPILSSHAEITANNTTAPAPQSRSNAVSGRCLPKTGIFQISAGDYRLIRARSGQIRSLETGRQFAKARHWQAFLVFPVVKSLWAGLPGWRPSADRTRLHANSLLSGNLTGNSAILSHLETVLAQKPAVLQPLIEQFPTQANREIISGNRDF